MDDWYERMIEPEVRELVRLLRNNGINTVCSCGHDMHVEADYMCDESIKETYDLVYNWLFENKKPITFKITWEVNVIDGCPFWGLLIEIDHKRG